MSDNVTTSMDIHEILDHLPHRYPFMLVDRVLSLDVGKEIVAVKNVSMNEPFFPGHFPYHPVMPGVLIVEAMAQAAAILSFKTMNVKPTDDAVYYFAGIDRILRGIWKYKGVALVDDQIVAEAEMMCILKEIA